MRRPMALLIVLAALAGCGREEAADRPLRVAVAANFAETFAAVAADWRADGGCAVETVSGATGVLAAQILQGAPYDLFLAADAARPAQLAARPGTTVGPPRDYALGVLVLWLPQAPPGAAGGPELLDGVTRLAVANPDLAPYGRAALETLERTGRAAALTPRLVRGNNVAQAWQFAASGNADAAFVAAAQVRAAGAVGAVWSVPAALHAPIRQQAVLLRDDPRARALLAYLCGPAGRARIAAAGYRLPEAAP